MIPSELVALLFACFGFGAGIQAFVLVSRKGQP